MENKLYLPVLHRMETPRLLVCTIRNSLKLNQSKTTGRILLHLSAIGTQIVGR